MGFRYADVPQVYLPLKPYIDGLETLRACLSDVKAWLSLNFLSHIVFGSSDSPSQITLGNLTLCKALGKELGFCFQ